MPQIRRISHTRIGARPRRFAGAAVAFGLMLASLAIHAAPGVGDPAPDFTLPGSDGASHSLAALRGHWVVVAFFPKAFTGG